MSTPAPPLPHPPAGSNQSNSGTPEGQLLGERANQSTRLTGAKEERPMALMNLGRLGYSRTPGFNGQTPVRNGLLICPTDRHLPTLRPTPFSGVPWGLAPDPDRPRVTETRVQSLIWSRHNNQRPISVRTKSAIPWPNHKPCQLHSPRHQRQHVYCHQPKGHSAPVRQHTR